MGLFAEFGIHCRGYDEFDVDETARPTKPIIQGGTWEPPHLDFADVVPCKRKGYD